MVEGGLGWCSVTATGSNLGSLTVSAQDRAQRDAGLLVLGSIRKQTEKVMGSKP